jgi:hypothetical protein
MMSIARAQSRSAHHSTFDHGFRRSPPRLGLGPFSGEKRKFSEKIAPAHHLFPGSVPQEGRALIRKGSACTFSGAIPKSTAADLR